MKSELPNFAHDGSEQIVVCGEVCAIGGGHQPYDLAPMAETPFPKLPCFPCPHHAACCAYGTTVTVDEAAAISAEFGEDRVYRTRWGEWRTRVRQGRCVLLVDGGCSIHAKPYFPAVCRGFPWTDAQGVDPYEYERTICPEFVQRPQLLDIHPIALPRKTQ